MAWLEHAPSGVYKVVFRFGDRKLKRSLLTDNPQLAEKARARVEENLRLVEQGRLDVPAGVDLAEFLLYDGKLTFASLRPTTRVGATIALSLLIFFIQRPIFEASASISLENIGLTAEKSRLIPPAEQVIASLQERYGARYHGLDSSRPYLLSVDLSRKESSVIYFVARGNSAKDVAEFLNTVVTEEIADAKKKIDSEIKAREPILNARRESLSMLQKQLALLNEKEDRRDSQGAFVVEAEKANIHQQSNFLEYEIYALEADTRRLATDEPRVLLPPTMENEISAARPDLIRYLVAGVVLGGMFAFLFPWVLAKLQIAVHSYES